MAASGVPSGGKPAGAVATKPADVQRVTYTTIFTKFVTIGAVSFGGGIIAYLQRMLIDDTKWLTEDEFMAALEISQTMPGLNAVNMSVIVGDRLRGPMGAIIAALGMLAPGAIFVFLLGLAASSARHATPLANAALKGVAAGAVGLLLAIALRTGHKSFVRWRDLVLMALTFCAMSLLKVNLLVIILTLGPIAIYAYRPREHGGV
jgi:chromate transporter